MKKESMAYEVPALQGYSEWEKFEAVRGREDAGSFFPNPNVPENYVPEDDEGGI